ncbi:DMT family transporter [Bacillus sp. ISL-35]|uniref:DMT family transporter n=1 Tax=Bacillus sp. ISL-35 TaxID=2819122 RepID=UPI001BE4E8D6|nr:DMT family transporter [Bacillus sp. ISL-35]MBT2679715.1 DMT family transporter [Bacillus sp. ISL-35]MBT2704749.1 DMT family transporter [Chryseobacterium sp. ISL-80]
MTTKDFFTHPLGIVVSAAGATFLWGSAFPFIKLSYASLDIKPDEIGEQMLFAGYRFLLAGLLILILFLFLKRNMKFRTETTKPLLKIGLFQTFLQYVLFYIGLSYSTGIQGSIIAGTTSFFQILLAHFLYPDDRMSRLKVAGLMIGFTGVIFANWPNGEYEIHFGIGEILLMGAMLAGAYGNILAKQGSAKMEVIYLTAYQMILGSLGLIAIGAFTVGLVPFDFDLKSGLMLIYLAFLSATGFILWNNVMKYNQVGKVSLYLFMVPVFGVLLSSMLLGEALHYFVIAGLVLVVAGIVIVNRPARKKNSLPAK